MVTMMSRIAQISSGRIKGSAENVSSTEPSYDSDFDRCANKTNIAPYLSTEVLRSEIHGQYARTENYHVKTSSRRNAVRFAYQGKHPLTLKDIDGIRPNRGKSSHGQDLTSVQRKFLERLWAMRRTAVKSLPPKWTPELASSALESLTISSSKSRSQALQLDKPLPGLPTTLTHESSIGPAKIIDSSKEKQYNRSVKSKKPFTRADYPPKFARLHNNMQPLLPSPMPPYPTRTHPVSDGTKQEKAFDVLASASSNTQQTTSLARTSSADLPTATRLSPDNPLSKIGTREDKIRARKLRDKHRAKHANEAYSVKSSPEQSLEPVWIAEKLEQGEHDKQITFSKASLRRSAVPQSARTRPRRSPRRLSRLTIRDWESRAPKTEHGMEDDSQRFSAQLATDASENDKRRNAMPSAAKRNSSTSPVDFAAAHPPPSQPAPPPPPPGPTLSCGEKRLSTALIELATYQRPSTAEKAVRWYGLNSEPASKVDDLRTFVSDSSSLPKQSQPPKRPNLKTLSGTECISATSTAQLIARNEFLERQNRLLENALIAVLHTGGKLNGCVCSVVESDGHYEQRSRHMNSSVERAEPAVHTSQINTSHTTSLREHERGVEKRRVATIVPDLPSDDDLVGISALDLYIATRKNEGKQFKTSNGLMAGIEGYGSDTEQETLSEYEFDSEDTTEDPTNGKKASEEGEELILGIAG